MKRVLLILVVLVLLAIGMGAGLLMHFDVHRYKGELVALVAKQTGRSFAIASAGTAACVLAVSPAEITGSASLTIYWPVCARAHSLLAVATPWFTRAPSPWTR